MLDRFQQINPKVIISVEAVSYNMKTHDHLGKLREVVQGIGNSLEKIVIVPFCTKDVSNVNLQPKEVFIQDFLMEYSTDAELEYEQVSLQNTVIEYIKYAIL